MSVTLLGVGETGETGSISGRKTVSFDLDPQAELQSAKPVGIRTKKLTSSLRKDKKFGSKSLKKFHENSDMIYFFSILKFYPFKNY